MKMKTRWPSTADSKEGWQHLVKLQDLPESQVTESFSINDFATWRASRFAVIENGFLRGADDS